MTMAMITKSIFKLNKTSIAYSSFCTVQKILETPRDKQIFSFFCKLHRSMFHYCKIMSHSLFNAIYYKAN